MVDETFRPTLTPTPPKIIPRPPKIIQDPWIEPGYVEKPDIVIDQKLDDVTDTTTITDIFQEQEPIQEQIQEPITPQIPVLYYPDYTKPPQRPPPKIPLRQKRRMKRKKQGGPTPLGYEMREYKLPSLGRTKEKGIKLPSLNIPPTKTKKSRKKLPPL